MPHVVIIAQHARQDARGGKKIQAQRGADVVVEAGVIEGSGSRVRVSELVVFFAEEEHEGDGVVVEGCAEGVGAGAHGDCVGHVGFVEGVAEPGLGAVQGGLFGGG